MFGGVARGAAQETGETAATFDDYAAAQKAVSTLISGDIPARQIAIVGLGLRSIERVTGRLGYATAARSGAINGVLLGLFFAALLVLGSPEVPMQAFVGVLFIGIAIGMLLSIVSYMLVRRRRDYASVMQVVADRYEVTVAADSIHRARQLLGGSVVPVGSAGAEPSAPSASAPPASAPSASTPPAAPTKAPQGEPRYGQRIDPAPAEGSDGESSPRGDAGSDTDADSQT